MSTNTYNILFETGHTNDVILMLWRFVRNRKHALFWKARKTSMMSNRVTTSNSSTCALVLRKRHSILQPLNLSAMVLWRRLPRDMHHHRLKRKCVRVPVAALNAMMTMTLRKKTRRLHLVVLPIFSVQEPQTTTHVDHESSYADNQARFLLRMGWKLVDGLAILNNETYCAFPQ